MNTNENTPALTLRPFTVQVPQTDLDDLRARLERTRYAAEPAKVKELAALMGRYVADGRSTPGPQQTNDVAVNWDKRGK